MVGHWAGRCSRLKWRKHRGKLLCQGVFVFPLEKDYCRRSVESVPIVILCQRNGVHELLSLLHVRRP
jgi:hypothetical protein